MRNSSQRRYITVNPQTPSFSTLQLIENYHYKEDHFLETIFEAVFQDQGPKFLHNDVIYPCDI